MKREIKDGQGFICKDLEEKKRIWEKLIQHRYPMFADGNDPRYKHIVWDDGQFAEANRSITYPLNEAEFFGENEWTPKAGEWVEVSQNGKDWGESIFLFTLGRFHMVSLSPLDYGKSGNFTPVNHIRQIQPETMTLQQAQEKLRELLNKPNLIIQP
jgi:hypothetical protein